MTSLWNRFTSAPVIKSIEKDDRSLFLFSPMSSVRSTCADIAASPSYATFSKIVAILYIGILLWASSRVDERFTLEDDALEVFYGIFAAIFTIEAIIKVIALGFFLNGPESYFRSGWTIIEGFVAICALITIDSNRGYLRMFLPLKALTPFSSIRVLVVSCARSMIGVRDVFIMIMVILYLFGLAAFQLFNGALRYRCVVDGDDPTDPDNWSDTTCSTSGIVLGMGGNQCPLGSSCLNVGENPSFGVYGFDNPAQAWFTNVICVSGEGWTDIMYYAEDATTTWARIYFMVLMILVYTFLLQLVVVILTEKFDESKSVEAEKEEKLLEARRLQYEAKLKAGGRDSKDNKVASWRQFKLVKGFNFFPEQGVAAASGADISAIQVNIKPEAYEKDQDASDRTYREIFARYFRLGESASDKLIRLKHWIHIHLAEDLSTGFYFFALCIVADIVLIAAINQDMSDETNENITIANDVFTGIFIFELLCKIYAFGPSVYFLGPRDPPEDGSESHLQSRKALFRNLNVVADMEESNRKKDEQLQQKIQNFQEHSTDLVVNSPSGSLSPTSSDSIESSHDDDNAPHKVKPDGKVKGGYGSKLLRRFPILRGRSVPYMNWFDTVVVIASVVELGIHGGAALIALRAFRLSGLLRVYVQFSGMAVVLDTVSQSIRDLSSFVMVVVLFVLVFALAGVSIFKDKFFIDGEQKRGNFNTFYMGAVSVFQVITPENWNDMVCNAIEAVGWGAAVYFLLIVIIGHYVLEGILIAILISNFNADDDESKFLGVREKFRVAFRKIQRRMAVNKYGERLVRSCGICFGVPDEEPVAQRSQQNMLEGQQRDSDDVDISENDFKENAEINRSEDGIEIPTINGKPKLSVEKIVATIPSYQNSFASTVLASLRKPLTSLPQCTLSIPHRRDEGILNVDNLENWSLHIRLVALTKPIRHWVRRHIFGKTDESPSSPSNDRSQDLLSPTSKAAMINSPVSSSSSPASPKQSNFTFSNLSSGVRNDQNSKSDQQNLVESDLPPDHTALFLFDPTNPFRLFIYRSLHASWVRFIVFCFIIISCVQCAIDSRIITPDGTVWHNLKNLNIVLFVFFTIEMVAKMIAYGVFLHPKAYARSGWNLIELFVWIDLAVCISDPYNLTAQGFQAFRALRLLSFFFSTRLVVVAFLSSLSKVGYVVVLVMMVFLVFAIIMVSYWSGRMQVCSNAEGTEEIAVPIEECAANGGVWGNPLWTGNYDNVGSAMLILFEITTEENWPDTMWYTVDATPYGLPSEFDYNIAACFFFVVFIIIGSFYIKSLFIGAVVDGYIDHFDRLTGSHDLVDLQKCWLDLYKWISDYPPATKYVPPYPLNSETRQSTWKIARLFFFNLVTHPYCENFFDGLIIANIVVMSMQHYGMSSSFESGTDTMTEIFTWIYLVELVTNVFAIGFRQFFTSHFNRFDAAIIILSCIASIPGVSIFGIAPEFFRVLRLFRVWKFLRRSDGISFIVRNLFFTIPDLLRVGLLLFVVYFIYGVGGMLMFGKVKKISKLTDDANFETIFQSFSILFRSSTGESWNSIMRELAVAPPFCTAGVDCGLPTVAILYCVSFQVVSGFLVISLVVAVVLAQFEQESGIGRVGTAIIVPLHDMRQLTTLWSTLSRTNSMNIHQLVSFLYLIPRSNSMAKPAEISMARWLYILNIPCNNGEVLYVDVAYRLCEYVLRQRYPYVKLGADNHTVTWNPDAHNDHHDDAPSDEINRPPSPVADARSIDVGSSYPAPDLDSSFQSSSSAESSPRPSLSVSPSNGQSASNPFEGYVPSVDLISKIPTNNTMFLLVKTDIRRQNDALFHILRKRSDTTPIWVIYIVTRFQAIWRGRRDRRHRQVSDQQARQENQRRHFPSRG